jgi:catechol 2,3-dioxygenase-like lactoylglutathione lyase family enzyme
MIKLDHLSIAVRDYCSSRDWYVGTLGLKLEFEIPERRTAALQDDTGFTLFVGEAPSNVKPEAFALYFQVGDVEQEYQRLVTAGLRFEHAPQKVFWGYGAELKDPDGYRVRLWDDTSMREKGSG